MPTPKIAFIGVSHWHFPLYVRNDLPEGYEIVAISDENAKTVERVSSNLNCKGYISYTELLDLEKPEFVFLFGQHASMCRIAKDVIERDIPFSIEKPSGLNTAEVLSIASFAKKKNVFSSVALVYRLSHEWNAIQKLGGDTSCCIANMSFRQFGGPPDRYRANGNGWMLDPAIAGGGCLINLGVHFIDMALALGGGADVILGSHVSNCLQDEDIEDYACVQLLLNSGGSAMIEVGYTMPINDIEQREMTISYANRNGFVHTVEDGLLLHRYNCDSEAIVVSLETDDYFQRYRDDTLHRFKSGLPPLASLYDMANTMRIVDAVYSKIEHDTDA